MTLYERTYRQLQQLLGGREYRRIENRPFMPLTVEKLEGQPLVSLCHYGEQNGDLMRDPEVVFLLREKTAIPIYFRNDWVGVERATVAGYLGDVPVVPEVQGRLDSFCSVWMRNIQGQGFLARARELSAREAPRSGPAAGGSEAAGQGESDRPGTRPPERHAEPGPDLDDGPDMGP